jgi:hypothetical protein
MAGKNTAVYGVYRGRAETEAAVDRLIKNGFRPEDIAILMADNVGNKDFAHTKGTKAPEGVTTGAVTGGAIGGTLGLLAGLGALAIPGLGPFIAAGPIMSTLAGLGAGGAVGGLVGALVGLGIPEYEAKRYEGRIKEGGVLLSVHSDNSDWTKRAKDILDQTGAENISSAGESSADYGRTDKPVPRSQAASTESRTFSTSGPATAGAEPMRRGVTSPVAEYDYEDQFRDDFNSRYYRQGVVYEDYAPAYRFGAACATSPRWANRDWSTVEPELRHDWEQRREGAWDRFRDAIRHGWERVRRAV